MAKLTEAQFREKIADGSILGLTVDTSIFDKYGCNLDFAVFRKIDQFRGTKIRFLLSEIVANEVKAHIGRDVAETRRALSTAFKKHRKRWKLANPDADPADLQADIDPKDEAQRQLDSFVQAVGAEIVPVGELTAEVLQRYFSVQPPFESNENKKYEFPDAFALLSLEAYAKRQGGLLLCVSGDKGWKDFIEQSNHLVFFVEDLDLALSPFNDSGRTVVERVLAMLRERTAPTVLEAIEGALQNRLDDTDFHPDGMSAMEYESTPVSAALQSLNWETASAPRIIAADDTSVTFSVKVDAKVLYEAEFSFFVYDSIDHDNVGFGSDTFETESDDWFEFAITISLAQNGEPEVLEAEVARQRLEVDFGHVDPFRNENPYDD